MKISINGDIIETDYIFKISSVKDNKHYIRNNNHIYLSSYNEFGKSAFLNINYNKFKYITMYLMFEIEIFNDNSPLKITYFPSIKLTEDITLLDVYKFRDTSISKICEFRQKIVNIWDNSDSKIPQYNI